MEKIELKFKRLSKEFDDISLPSYSTDGSSGMDIRAAVENEEKILCGKVKMISTNLAVEIPKGFEIQVRPRSGLAAKRGIGVLNSPGTIDSDYRGEVKIILFNFGEEDFVIKRGDRIAQLVVAKTYSAKIIETSDLLETERGAGGFGHTGKS